MEKKLQNFFGIDFGTTSSATVGYMEMEGHVPEEFLYGDAEGRPIPSVVAIDKKTGEVYTGREAWDKKMELSESCEYISSVKTLIAKDISYEIAGREWTPVDIAAELFKSLKNRVKERTGVELTSSTVAIPVGFSPEKRKKIRIAASKAGIYIDSFISEPTAAFFANYKTLRSSSIVAVFDWGGGTLDVSILRNEKGRIYELATAGIDVAGDYIDEKIARRMHAKIARKKGKEIAFDDMPSSAKDMMLVRAERAKRALGDDDTATISINNYGAYGACREIIDYDWFAEIVAPVVTNAMDCLKKAIDQSGVGLGNIDRIVMVGGSSNLGPLLDQMDETYGNKLYFPEETMWNVGQGAAQLNMNPGCYYSNQSVGIVLSDNKFFELLSEDTPLDNWQKECHFGIVDTDKEARFVFGGSPDINESPESFKVLPVPTYRFLQEKIGVKAFVDADMVLRVEAGSSMRPKEYTRVWEYPRLKCYYRLPEKRS